MVERFRDPRQEFFIIEIRMVDSRGEQCDHGFHVRLTEEEYEELAARSRRQYERGSFPSGDFRPSNYANAPWSESRGPRRQQRRYFMDGDPSWFFSFDGFDEDPFAEFNRKREEARRQQERAKANQGREAPKPSTAPKKSALQQRMRLAELAGVEWPTEIETVKLWKRAQRKCHPDVEGGSHELWIELEQIAIYFNLVKGSARTR